ncbi:MAG TPA: hypothetical protein VFN87_00470 [Solirubrobacteraceae bacterium]|nr:hypothetical protein [Solirubrobacteraceae bacterium]
MRWKLTERAGPKVSRSSFDDVAGALDALEARARELSLSAPREPVDAKIRRFEPEQRVIARLEVSGPERFVPSVRAGVDVHGDGSVQAFRGRVRREPVPTRGGETAYTALRRVLL